MEVNMENMDGYSEVEWELLKSKCYDAIYATSKAYPFRLDVQNKTIYFFGPIFESFKLNPIIRDYPQPVIDSGVLHKDDVDVFKRMVSAMYEGQESTTEVFRVWTDVGEVRWYSVRYTVIRDEQGIVRELIGEFVNEQEKKELEIKLHTDPLTGCLNKISFEKFVADELLKSTEDEKHALIIIDIDNFKAINDNLGHLFGDLVLREAGAQLRGLFRTNDYVGRIGGDEFMVFMKNVVDIDIVKDRVSKVVEMFRKNYKGNIRDYQISASIGIVMFPQDGKGFKKLYEHADIALYDTKSRGKNGYSFYHSTMVEGTMSNTTPFDAATRALSQFFDHQIIIDIFGLLSDAKDYEASVNKALELLGKRFNVERSYIFERKQDNERYMSNTYEWCAPGVSSEKEYLQEVPQGVYEPCISRMNESGIFYCNSLEEFQGEETFDVMREQGILSFLFSFNVENGNVVNMVGFDDCRSKRVWSSVEIGTLMHASKVLNQFLKYKAAVTEVSNVAKERLNVLDEINSFAYITDMKTNQLHYVNETFKRAFPGIREGDLCYEVLHNKQEPCKYCPMTAMKEKNLEKYRGIMRMLTLDKKVLVNASKVKSYAGREGVFFSCSSIEDLDYNIMDEE